MHGCILRRPRWTGLTAGASRGSLRARPRLRILLAVIRGGSLSHLQLHFELVYPVAAGRRNPPFTPQGVYPVRELLAPGVGLIHEGLTGLLGSGPFLFGRRRDRDLDHLCADERAIGECTFCSDEQSGRGLSKTRWNGKHQSNGSEYSAARHGEPPPLLLCVESMRSLCLFWDNLDHQALEVDNACSMFRARKAFRRCGGST